MPKVKQRSSAAIIVSRSALNKTSTSLANLPERPKEFWSLRETVVLLQDDITLALRRGYSYEEIVQVLADKKIFITASSLKRYLATARREREDMLRGSSHRRAVQAQPVRTRADVSSSAQPKAAAKRQTKSVATNAKAPRSAAKTRRTHAR